MTRIWNHNCSFWLSTKMAPWWRFLCEPKHVGATVGVLIVLIFLWFYNCVHHCGKINSALIFTACLPCVTTDSSTVYDALFIFEGKFLTLCTLQNWRFSQQCCWRFQSSVMYCHVVRSSWPNKTVPYHRIMESSVYTLFVKKCSDGNISVPLLYSGGTHL
jgi:hypothetical protein